MVLFLPLLSSCAQETINESGTSFNSPPKPIEVPIREDYKKVLQLAAGPSVTPAASRPSSLEVWSSRMPEPKSAKDVSLTCSGTRYVLRVPANWSVRKVEAPSTESFFCRAPEREDRSAAMVMIALSSPNPLDPASKNRSFTVEESMEQALKSTAMTRKGWAQSKPEWGSINKKSWLRAHWSGDVSGSACRADGFTYVTQLGRSNLVISAQDVSRYAGETLPVIEASVLRLQECSL